MAFVSEKKNQKSLAKWRKWPGKNTRQIAKVFCFFSSEKKTFLPSFLATEKPPRISVGRVTLVMAQESLTFRHLPKRPRADRMPAFH
jgi:hypothetical protein